MANKEIILHGLTGSEIKNELGCRSDLFEITELLE
jgi:hypothetical protein